MAAPTCEEIQAEIAELRRLQPLIRRYDIFGGDNHEKIIYQIDVLDGTIDDVENDVQENDDLRSHGDAALEWLDGDSLDGKPSDSWKDLVI